MATCGHCKQPGQTIQHVRTCGQAGSAVTTAERTLPELAPGNVVTLSNAGGYWIVQATGGDQARVQQFLPGGKIGAAAEIYSREVELLFPGANAAIEYDLALRTEATKRRNRETLHGDPDYCRGCAEGWAGAKWHRVDCPRIQAIADAARAEGQRVVGTDDMRQVADRVSDNVWAPVTELRNRVKAHLHYETKQGTHKRMGHFAIEAGGTLKFLVIKELLAGRHAGRVFVDSMGSDTAYPVKAPATLTAYLTAVLADPAAAAKRYSDEMDACNHCGRPLTNELSRSRGIGPECWAKRG